MLRVVSAKKIELRKDHSNAIQQQFKNEYSIRQFSTQNKTKLDENFKLKNGDTILHETIRDKSYADFTHLVKTVDSHAISIMATTFNDMGRLPYKLIRFGMNLEEQAKISETLLPFMLQHSLPNIDAPVDFKKVIADYHIEPHTLLYSNVFLACESQNATRRTFKRSATHPKSNLLTQESRRALKKEVEALRDDANNKSQQTLDEYKIKKDQFKFDVEKGLFKLEDQKMTIPFSVGLEYLNAETKCFEEKAIANCYEYSINNFKKAIELSNGKVAGQILDVENGDHVIVKIGEKAEDSAISDSWSGAVYPYTSLKTNMKTFWHYAHLNHQFKIVTHYNVVGSYNPKFHIINPSVSYHPTKKDTCSLQMFGLYSSAKKSVINNQVADQFNVKKTF